MAEVSTICPECGAQFLQATADSNGGFCLKCRPRQSSKRKNIDHGSVAEGMELSLRLVLAFAFGFGFAGLGYAAGAMIWTGFGVLLAFASFPVGFVYGFFCDYINSFIRSLFGGD